MLITGTGVAKRGECISVSPQQQESKKQKIYLEESYNSISSFYYYNYYFLEIAIMLLHI